MGRRRGPGRSWPALALAVLLGAAEPDEDSENDDVPLEESVFYGNPANCQRQYDEQQTHFQKNWGVRLRTADSPHISAAALGGGEEPGASGSSSGPAASSAADHAIGRLVRTEEILEAEGSCVDVRFGFPITFWLLHVVWASRTRPEGVSLAYSFCAPKTCRRGDLLPLADGWMQDHPYMITHHILEKVVQEELGIEGHAEENHEKVKVIRTRMLEDVKMSLLLETLDPLLVNDACERELQGHFEHFMWISGLVATDSPAASAPGDGAPGNSSEGSDDKSGGAFGSAWSACNRADYGFRFWMAQVQGWSRLEGGGLGPQELEISFGLCLPSICTLQDAEIMAGETMRSRMQGSSDFNVVHMAKKLHWTRWGSSNNTEGTYAEAFSDFGVCIVRLSISLLGDAPEAEASAAEEQEAADEAERLCLRRLRGGLEDFRRTSTALSFESAGASCPELEPGAGGKVERQELGSSCGDFHGIMLELRLANKGVPGQPEAICGLCVPRACVMINGLAPLSNLGPQLMRLVHGSMADALLNVTAVRYPPSPVVAALEPDPIDLPTEAWPMPATGPPRPPEPTVIIPATGHSEAYSEHISSMALALDAVGLWRVWLLGGDKVIHSRRINREDQHRLETMNLEQELTLVAEMRARWVGVPFAERPLIVVLHYGWPSINFGLGFNLLEQLPEPTRHIFVTVYETDGSTLAVKTLTRRMDEVWTTCWNNAVDLRASQESDPGAAVPVFDIPAAMPIMQMTQAGDAWVNPLAARNAARALLPDLPLRASAVFLFMKRHNYDTGWDSLIRAFVRAFPPGPEAAVLVLKLGYRADEDARQRARKALYACKECPSDLPANVLVLAKRLGDEEMRILFELADAYVEPSRGSGCMSVTGMQMAALGKPIIGPTWNYCSNCRMADRPEGPRASGVLSVELAGSIPAYTEVWQDFLFLTDQLDQDFVQVNETHLQRRLQELAALDEAGRREVGLAAKKAMGPLTDRLLVGRAVNVRLEALQAQHVATGRSKRPPRLARRWAPLLQDASGAALAPVRPPVTSWAPFVPETASSQGALSAQALVVAAVEAQIAVGRQGPHLSAKLRGDLGWYMSLGEWDAARKAAEQLYKADRSAEALLALSIAWLQQRRTEPALFYVEMAWEMQRRPLPRPGHAPPGVQLACEREQESAELPRLIKDVHCTIVRALPASTRHYDYIRVWPTSSRCQVAAASRAPRARATAHVRAARLVLKGVERWTMLGCTPDFAMNLKQQTEAATKFALVARHLSNAVLLQPQNGTLWQELGRSLAARRVTEPRRPFPRDLALRSLKRATTLLPADFGTARLFRLLLEDKVEDAVSGWIPRREPFSEVMLRRQVAGLLHAEGGGSEMGGRRTGGHGAVADWPLARKARSAAKRPPAPKASEGAKSNVA